MCVYTVHSSMVYMIDVVSIISYTTSYVQRLLKKGLAQISHSLATRLYTAVEWRLPRNFAKLYQCSLDPSAVTESYLKC